MTSKHQAPNTIYLFLILGLFTTTCATTPCPHVANIMLHLTDLEERSMHIQALLYIIHIHTCNNGIRTWADWSTFGFCLQMPAYSLITIRPWCSRLVGPNQPQFKKPHISTPPHPLTPTPPCKRYDHLGPK